MKTIFSKFMFVRYSFACLITGIKKELRSFFGESNTKGFKHYSFFSRERHHQKVFNGVN